MKLPPLHPFSRRYLLPGQKPNNANHRLIISPDPEINLQSLLDGSTGSAVFEGLGKRQSIASFLRLVELNERFSNESKEGAWQSWSDEIKGATGFGNEDDPCVNNDQPDGNLLEEEEIEPSHGDREEAPSPHEPANQESPTSKGGQGRNPESDPCRGWRMEFLAWYSDAHRNEIRDYGIHIRRGSVAKILPRIENYLSRKGKPQDPKILMFSILFKIYAHELCHGWVEDLCSLIDFLHEETAERAKRRHALTLDRLRAYIFLEEALCNTAAHGLLQHQLQALHGLRNAGGIGASLLAFEPDKVMDAFREWMRSQPKGYRDFSEISERPQESSLFKANLVRLLTDPRIYGYRHDPFIIRDIVEGYFAQPDDGSLDLLRHLNGFRCTPSVYLEGIEDGIPEMSHIIPLLDPEERDIFGGIF